MAGNEKSNSGNGAKAKNPRKPGTFGCIPLWIMHLIQFDQSCLTDNPA